MSANLIVSLPPELVVLVLQELVPSGSLVSALLASSYLHNVFENQKASILSAFVEKHVHPSILPDAVMAVSPFHYDSDLHSEVHMTDEEWNKWEDEAQQGKLAERPYDLRYNHWRARLREMGRTYLARRTGEQIVQNLPLPVTIPLCRLLRSIEGLSKLLVARAWKTFQETGYQDLEIGDQEFQPTASMFSPLSLIEKARIHRACFRFQMICNLFDRMPERRWSHRYISDDPDGGYAIEQQIIGFLRQYPPWENEELLSLQQFLSSELGRVIDRVQERFVERTVAEEGAKFRSMTRAEGSSDDDSSGDIGIGRFSTHDSHFSALSKRREDEHIDWIISKGLNFLFNLLKGDAWDTPEQEHTIVNSHGELLMSLRQVVDNYGWGRKWKWHEQTLDSDSDCKERTRDDLGQCNEGYLWALNYRQIENVFAEEQDFLLREWAYVFWDDERLSRMGVSQMCPRRDRRLQVAGHDNVQGRSTAPSAEKILKDKGFVR